MRSFLAAAAILAAPLLAAPPAAIAQPAPKPLVITHPVQDKVVPFLSLIERDKPALAALSADPELSRISSAWRERLVAAQTSCAMSAACYTTAAKLSPEETAAIETALRRLGESNAAVKRFAEGPLRQSGIAPKADKSTAPERLADAWRGTAAMIANLVSVYGEAGPTRYPSIDALRADARSDGYGRTLRLLTALMLERHPATGVFLAGPADFALQLMVGDERHEAGRHEPMSEGENKAAFHRMGGINWRNYPYTAIIVPGAGPEDPTVHLTATSRIRAQLGLERWKQGKAPFIIVSGGYVHPNRTKYSEAIEMKRSLMTEFGVPEDAIIVDPHARHTTTNVRNAARLLFRYGAPVGRKALVVTDEGQAGSIAADAFDKRNLDETGVVPYSSKAKLSPFEVEITPSLDALQLNPTDPLDP